MTIRSDLKRAAEAVMGMDYPWDHTVRDGRLGKTSTEYARLAHPSNVLALIEHNELLTARLCECKSCGGEGELHSGDWHHYGHMEPPEPVMEKCGECDGSGRIGDIQDLDNSLAEIQRLKAEKESANSRLHEVVVACASAEQERDQLKAECEGLRKDAERYRWLKAKHQDVDSDIGVYDGANILRTEAAIYDLHLDMSVDRLMRKESGQ